MYLWEDDERDQVVSGHPPFPGYGPGRIAIKSGVRIRKYLDESRLMASVSEVTGHSGSLVSS